MVAEALVTTDKADNRVGTDIRSLRKSRGMVLADLSTRLGRSVGWLSQVERGQTTPSISDLKSVARIFNLPVSFFFRNEAAPSAEQGVVVRAAARASIGSAASGLSEELLSPDISGEFEMIRSVFEPGAVTEELEARPTEDGGYVVSGNLDLWVSGRRFRLAAGDSFQFARQPYRWRNPGSEPAVVIWVISPPVY